MRLVGLVSFRLILGMLHCNWSLLLESRNPHTHFTSCLAVLKNHSSFVQVCFFHIRGSCVCWISRVGAYTNIRIHLIHIIHITSLNHITYTLLWSTELFWCGRPHGSSSNAGKERYPSPPRVHSTTELFSSGIGYIPRPTQNRCRDYEVSRYFQLFYKFWQASC